MSRGPLLVFLAGLWLPSLQEVVFRCPSCTTERLSACPPGRPTTPLGPCIELAREPGCGCCPVCARLEGESCGVYTSRCGQGLRCYPSPGSELPLQALVHGQGTCIRRKDEYGASQERVTTEITEDKSEDVLMENPSEGALTAVANGGGNIGGTSGKKPYKAGMKELALTRDKTQDQQKQHNRPHKLPNAEKLRPPVIRTPCQQQLDQVLERISSLPLADERSHLETLYALPIPNCDKNGLFNMKQCKMSLNGQRGECSCVDPNTGKQIPGAPTVRGDPECHLYYPGPKPEERGTLALRLQ